VTPSVTIDHPVAVMVVDDHDLFRRAIAGVLSTEPDLEVVGQARSKAEALALVNDIAPDVILLDVRMPGGGGVQTCAELLDLVPSARVVMLTGSDEEQDLFDALAAGACGYLLKDLAVDELPDALRKVAAGQSLLSPALAGRLLNEFRTRIAADTPSDPPKPTLTVREIEVLQQLSRGLTNKAIARELYVSENTVKNHVRNILHKLELRSRIEAVMYATQHGLVTWDATDASDTADNKRAS
jgi:DNA-binding NarL/FixJ family response regulator